MFYGGDSDSIGVIAACCYGVMYGFDGVSERNYKVLILLSLWVYLIKLFFVFKID